jgi:quercetin dioxygenase-like cupin family protein
MSTSVSLPNLLDSFTEKWSPRLIAAVNDHHVKVAKIDGEFIWHSHPNSDELFYLIAGGLRLEIEGRDPIDMNVGDVFVIPKGIRHRPVAKDATILMIEHETTINTGDEPESSYTKEVTDARQA